MAAPEQPLKTKDPTGYPTNKKTLDDIGFYETLLSGIYDLPETKMGPTPMQTVMYGESSGESGYSPNAPVRTIQKTKGDAERIKADIAKTGSSASSYIANPMNYTGIARGTLQMEPTRIQDAIDYLVAEEKKGNQILDKASSILSKVSPTKITELDTLKALVKEKATNPMLTTYSIDDIRNEMTNYPNPILDIALSLAATKASKTKEKLYPQMSYSGKATADYQAPADKEAYTSRVDYYLKTYYK